MTTNKDNQTLYKTLIFRWSLIAPILLAVAVSGLICIDNEVSFSFKKHDLNELFDTFHLTIICLALIVPLTALSAAVHRSEQNAIQIEKQVEQNHFSNHFKHLEEFKKSIPTSRLEVCSIFGSIEELHRCVYPNTVTGDLKPSPASYQASLQISDFLDDLSRGKLTIREDFETLCEDICINLKTNSRGLRPNHLHKLSELLNDSINFSGLHKPATGMKSLDLAKLTAYVTIHDFVEQIICSPVDLKSVEKNGFADYFQLSIQYKKAHNIPAIEAWVITSVLYSFIKADYPDFGLMLGNFNKSDTNYFRSIFDRYVTIFNAEGNYEVILIDNYLKDSGL